MKRSNKIKATSDAILFNLIGAVFLGLIGAFSILPFIILISGSFSNETSIMIHGYSFLPRGFSLDAYRSIFLVPDQIGRAYLVTISITAIGTAVSLFFNSMTAYVLSRKDFPHRNKIAFYFYFTTLFNGGLIGYYVIMVLYYGMKDNIFALIVPGFVNVFYLLMMRNFITQTVHEALIESARIDGANDPKIYFSVVLPLMTPALAAIGLFIALGYWNDWWNAMLFIDTPKLYPLQYTLHRVISSIQNVELISATAKANMRMPKETIKLAMTVVATGPIIFAYPFVQKYFVQGITMGAVKG